MGTPQHQAAMVNLQAEAVDLVAPSCDLGATVGGSSTALEVARVCSIFSRARLPAVWLV